MQEKRKVTATSVAMFVFFICLSACIASAADYTSQNGTIPDRFRLSLFDYSAGGFTDTRNRSFSYVEQYPFIRKSDLQGGYADYYRDQDSPNFDYGLSGRPVYLTDGRGELNGFIVPEIGAERGDRQIWEGNLTRFDLERLPSPDLTIKVTPLWDLKSDLEDHFTGSLGRVSQRNLSFWQRQYPITNRLNTGLVEGILRPSQQSAGSPKFDVANLYTRSNTANDNTNYLRYSGTNIDLSSLMGLGGVGSNWYSDVRFTDPNTFTAHPSHWMLAWMAGKDSNMGTSTTRRYPVDPPTNKYRKIMPDLGQAVFGHISANNGNKYVFAHTNDGLLHMINNADRSVNGSREVMAFIPPQALYGKRLMQQKFDIRSSSNTVSTLTGTGKLKTALNVNGWLPAGQAYPGFLTDGAVIARRLYTKSDGTEDVVHTGIYSVEEMDPKNIKPHVFGLMGRGGAGMYLLRMEDEGNESKLHLGWAMENDMYRYLSRRTTITNLAATSLINGNGSVQGSTYTGQDNTNGMMGTMRFWLPNQEGSVSPTNWDYTNGRLSGRDGGVYKQHDHWRLGWNVPPPVVGMVEFRKAGAPGTRMISTVIFISAGQQFFSDPREIGTIGSAVYVISPVSGVGVWRRSAWSYAATGSGTNYNDIGNIGNNRTRVPGWDAGSGYPLGVQNPLLGMMVTPPLAMYLGEDQTPDAGNDFLRSVFTADHRGDIYEAGFCNEQSNGRRGDYFAVPSSYNEAVGTEPNAGNPVLYQEIKFRRIGTLRPDDDNDNTSYYAIPYQLTMQLNPNNLNDIWLFGGTADLPTLNFSRKIGVGSASGNEESSEFRANKKQYLFGLKRQPWGAYGSGLNDIHATNDIWIGKNAPESNTYPRRHETFDRSEPEKVISWKLELGSNESVSTQPSLQVDPDTGETYLYASTYVTNPPHSRIYRLHPQTGKPAWTAQANGGYYKDIGNVHVKGIDQVNLDGQPTTLISYSGQDSISGAFEDEGKKGEELFKKDRIGIFSLKDPPVDVEITTGLFYWRRYNI